MKKNHKIIIVIFCVVLLGYVLDSIFHPVPDFRRGKEAIKISGKVCVVEYVEPGAIRPAFGVYRGLGEIKVRKDLPGKVMRFVRSHELTHCTDKSSAGGWLGRELRANLYPALYDPYGFMGTVLMSLSPERLSFYISRFKAGQ